MEQISIINQIFDRFFENLSNKLDEKIIENLKKAFGKGKLTETKLNAFIEWLKDFNNAKDKEC